MDTLLSNAGWIIILILLLFILIYRKVFNAPNAITSKFVISQTINEENWQNKILESLKKSGFKKVGYVPDEEKFYALAGVTMSSWGEEIIIKINNLNDGVTIDFMSICAFPFQVYDWGKNKRNYRRFLKELKKLSL